MNTINLEANASNWSEVTNKVNYNNIFICPNGKKFKLVCHKKAHYTWEGKESKGAQSEVKILWEGESKETVITAHKLKSLCGVAKETKGETKPRKALGQKIEELFYNSKEEEKTTILLNFILSLDDCPKWLQDAKKAEDKRIKEEEEKRRKAEEDKEFERLLKARGFSLKDLKKSK